MDENETLLTPSVDDSFTTPESPEVRRWREIEPEARADMPVTRAAVHSDPPCPCGSPALFVFTTKQFGDVTWCGV